MCNNLHVVFFYLFFKYKNRNVGKILNGMLIVFISANWLAVIVVSDVLYFVMMRTYEKSMLQQHTVLHIMYSLAEKN